MSEKARELSPEEKLWAVTEYLSGKSRIALKDGDLFSKIKKASVMRLSAGKERVKRESIVYVAHSTNM